ncbi:biotin/lipoyl-binding protein, partial [Yersinia pestis]
MSESAGAQAPQRPQNKKQQRKRVLLLLTAIFIMIGVAYLIYWFLVLRHHQETDNAYISGNQVQIMSQVPGSVVSVHFENTDFVKSGDVLVTLDPTDAEQAFEQAKTALANSVRQTHQLIINSKQYQANIALKKTELSQAQNDLKRRVVLGAAAV